MSRDISTEATHLHRWSRSPCGGSDTAIDFYATATNDRTDASIEKETSATPADRTRAEARSRLTTSISPLAAAHAAPNATIPIGLLRQMRARIAFQRASTRLYEVLLDKLDASACAALRSQRGSLNRNTLLRFRNEEAAHFELLCESLESIGIDPVDDLGGNGDHDAGPQPQRARTDAMDAADVLNALLDTELTDEAGWQRLVATAHDCGLDDLAHRFEQAHSEEIGHVRQLRAWTVMLPAAQRRVA